MADGCEIGNSGYSFVLEAFYNPDGIRRFGTELFGDDVFGDGTTGASDPRWVDVTPYAHSVVIERGSDIPTTNIPTDTITWTWRDFPADWVEWAPPASFASPAVGTPVRAGIQQTGDPATYGPIGTFRIFQLRDIHDTRDREIEVTGYGTKADLVTPLLFPDRPNETAQARIAAVLAEIGWAWGVTYPADLADFGLSADPGQPWLARTGDRALAWAMVSEAAWSAGYAVAIDNAGGIIFSRLQLDPAVVPQVRVGDCADVRVDAVTTSIDFTTDAEAVLNVVQLVNVQDPNNSAEAIDATSVDIWGRRAQGYGFPLTVVNDDQADAQAIADAYLAQTADLVNRVERVGFNTAVDPRWFQLMADGYIGEPVEVLRFHPRPLTAHAAVIGATYIISPEMIEGSVALSSSTLDAGVPVGYLTTDSGDYLTTAAGDRLTI